jgi:hypothetical protein
MYDVEIQSGVFVNGYVAEADHPLHALSEVIWKNAGSLQQRGLAAVLGHPELPLADHVYGEDDGRFTARFRTMASCLV